MKRTMTRITRALWSGLVFVVVAVIVVGCSGGSESLGAADNGGTITLKQGRELKVTLEGNPSTGFGWQVADDSGVLEQVGEPVFDESQSKSGSSEPVVGAAGNQVFTFKTIKAGSGELRLEYKRSWETTVPPEKTYAVTVTVE